MPATEVEKVENSLSARFARAVTVKGTKQYHRFSSQNIQNITVRELFSDNDGKEVKVFK